MIELVKYNTHGGRGWFWVIKKIRGVDLAGCLLQHNTHGPAVHAPEREVGDYWNPHLFYFFGVKIHEVPEMPVDTLTAATIAYRLLQKEIARYSFIGTTPRVILQFECIRMAIYHEYGPHILDNFNLMVGNELF